MKPAETDVESLNRTYIYEKDKVKRRLILMRDKLKSCMRTSIRSSAASSKTGLHSSRSSSTGSTT